MRSAVVTLCIVNHNGADQLPPAFRAVLAQADEFAEVLLIDNASTDGSVQLAQAQFPRLRVVSLPSNAGPGSARNAGFAAASHDLILFQDYDVRLEPGCVATLLAALRERVGALLVAPRVLYEGAPGTIQYDSADCHFLGLMATRNANRQIRDTPDVGRADHFTGDGLFPRRPQPLAARAALRRGLRVQPGGPRFRRPRQSLGL